MEIVKKKRLLVFASGRGSNFEAIANAIQQGKISGAEIISLLCNKTDAEALIKAKSFQIPTHVIISNSFKKDGKFDRESYEEELTRFTQKMNPDWIILAGYMLLLGKKFIQTFEGKIINIHPSLLPKHKGLHAQKQALVAKENETGCTVHIVTEEMDAGPIIAQSRIPILPTDTEESLSARLLPVEHETYIRAIQKLCG